MSAQSMESTQGHERNRRSSSYNSDRAISRADDTSFEMVREPSLDHCQRMDNCYTLCPSDDRRSSFHPRSPDPIGFQLDEHLAFYLSSPDDEPRPNAPTRAKTSNSKQARNNSELDQRSSRRSSVQSSRSRTNSCSRPTSLGRRQLGHQTFRSMRNARTVRYRSRLMRRNAAISGLADFISSVVLSIDEPKCFSQAFASREERISANFETIRRTLSCADSFCKFSRLQKSIPVYDVAQVVV